VGNFEQLARSSLVGKFDRMSAREDREPDSAAADGLVVRPIGSILDATVLQRSTFRQ
jgi:hypothetical protein